MDPSGENLIFIVCQPRSGSMLLRNILRSHPYVQTVSEGWLMLYPLYALRSEGFQAEYDEHRGQRGLRRLLAAIPSGDKAYFEGVHRMYGHLYEQALAASGRRLFPDKTPRYFLVLPELYRTFPEAKFVILLRNPLAVLCSVINTWIKDGWFRLGDYRLDLIEAPALLVEGIKLLGERALVVHYEPLIQHPESEMRRLCKRLGFPAAPQVTDQGAHKVLRWEVDDRASMPAEVRIDSSNAERWQQTLTRPQVWRLVDDYLHLLGEQTIESMGYSYTELCQVVDAHRPRLPRTWLTLPLGTLMKRRFEQRAWWIRLLTRLARSLRTRGAADTAHAVAREVKHVLSSRE